MSLPASSVSKSPNYIVPALARGLDVLTLLSEDTRVTTVSEITQRLKLPRASVFRILWTLQQTGFVETDPSGKSYRLGPGVLRLGYQYLANRDIAQVARPDVEDLARRTGVSAHLAIRDGADIVYLVHAIGNSTFVSNLGIGDRLPAHATPMGQLLLGQLSREELAILYKERPMEALTSQTPRTKRALGQKVADALAAGFVISHGAVHTGGKSIAAPIHDAAGKIVAAIDISGPDQAFEGAAAEARRLKEVLRVASSISSRLGHR